jgi:hypothetical protein
MKKLLMIVGMMLAAALVPVWAAEQVAGSDRLAPDGVVSFTLAADKFVVHEWGVHIRSVVPVLYETPTLIPKTMGAMEMKVVDDPSAKPRSVLAPPGQLVSDLPDFVLRHANEYHPRFSAGNWDKPVLHFYGREGTEVTVQVLTPQGRPLAYWPKPKMVEKDGYREDLHGYGLAGPELLGLSWTGRLAAKPTVEPKAVKEGHWWQTVRQVPSLWFDTGTVSERFIFYEATALQEPTVSGKVADDVLTLTNRDANATGPVMVIVNDGQTRRFVSVATIGANQVATLSRKEIESADGDAAKLLAACRAQWEAFGMTREEAQAIVETWKADLLEKTGFLVISRMPAKAYDAMFPLKITPAPDQVVRAGVIFDTLPGEESRLVWLPGIEAQLRKIADDLARGEPVVRAAAVKQLLARGELAGGLAAQLAKSDDPEARAAAAEFQRAMRAERVVMPAFLKQPQADR